MHAGDQLAQRLGGVVHRAAKDTGVQIVVGAKHAQLEVSQAAQGVGDGGHVGIEDAGIGIEGEIAGQQLFVAFHERHQAG